MDNFERLLPKGLILSYLVKMLIVSASIADVGILMTLAGIMGSQMYLEKNKKVQQIEKSLNQRYEEVVQANLKANEDTKRVCEKTVTVVQEAALEIAKLKNDMSGIKLKEGFKRIA